MDEAILSRGTRGDIYASILIMSATFSGNYGKGFCFWGQLVSKNCDLLQIRRSEHYLKKKKNQSSVKTSVYQATFATFQMSSVKCFIKSKAATLNHRFHRVIHEMSPTSAISILTIMHTFFCIVSKTKWKKWCNLNHPHRVCVFLSYNLHVADEYLLLFFCFRSQTIWQKIKSFRLRVVPTKSKTLIEKTMRAKKCAPEILILCTLNK